MIFSGCYSLVLQHDEVKGRFVSDPPNHPCECHTVAAQQLRADTVETKKKKNPRGVWKAVGAPGGCNGGMGCLCHSVTR